MVTTGSDTIKGNPFDHALRRSNSLQDGLHQAETRSQRTTQVDPLAPPARTSQSDIESQSGTFGTRTTNVAPFDTIQQSANALAENFVRHDPHWNDKQDPGFWSRGKRHASEGHLHAAHVALNTAYDSLVTALVDHRGSENQYDPDLPSQFAEGTAGRAIEDQRKELWARAQNGIQTVIQQKLVPEDALAGFLEGKPPKELASHGVGVLVGDLAHLAGGKAGAQANLSQAYDNFVDAQSDYSIAFANRVYAAKDGAARQVDPTALDIAANVLTSTIKNLAFTIPVLVGVGGVKGIAAQAAFTSALQFGFDYAGSKFQSETEDTKLGLKSKNTPAPTVSLGTSRDHSNKGPYHSTFGETAAKNLTAIVYSGVNAGIVGGQNLATSNWGNVAGVGLGSAFVSSLVAEGTKLGLQMWDKRSEGAERAEDMPIQKGARGKLVSVAYNGTQSADNLRPTEENMMRYGKQVAGFVGAFGGFLAAGAAYQATGLAGTGNTRSSVERFGELAAPFLGYFTTMGIAHAGFDAMISDTRTNPQPAARSGLDTLQQALRQSGLEATMSLYNDMIPKYEQTAGSEAGAVFSAARNVLSDQGQVRIANGEANEDLDVLSSGLQIAVDSITDRPNADGSLNVRSPMAEMKKHLMTANVFVNLMKTGQPDIGVDPELGEISQTVKLANVKSNLRMAHAWLMNSGLKTDKQEPALLPPLARAGQPNPVHQMAADLLPVFVGLRAADQDTDNAQFADKFVDHIANIERGVTDKKTDQRLPETSAQVIKMKDSSRQQVGELLGATGKKAFDPRKVASRVAELLTNTGGSPLTGTAREQALRTGAQEFKNIADTLLIHAKPRADKPVAQSAVGGIAQAQLVSALLKSEINPTPTPIDTRPLANALNSRSAARIGQASRDLLSTIATNGATAEQLQDALEYVRRPNILDAMSGTGDSSEVLKKLAELTDFTGGSIDEAVTKAITTFKTDAVQIHSRHADLLTATLKGTPTLDKPFGLDGSNAVHKIEEQKDIHFHIDDYNLRRGEAAAIHYLMRQNGISAATMAGIPHAVMGASYYDKVSPDTVSTLARLKGKPSKPVSYRQGDMQIAGSFKTYESAVQDSIAKRRDEIRELEEFGKQPGIEHTLAKGNLTVQDVTDVTDAMKEDLARSEALLKEIPTALNLSVTGIDINNAKDMGAAMDEVMRTYPGMVKSVGEVTLYKEVVSRNSGQIPRIDSAATSKLFDDCAERGLPLVLHCDIARAGPGGKEAHRSQIVSALEKAVQASDHRDGYRTNDQLAKSANDINDVPLKKVSVVWCHGAGLSRYTPAANDHTAFVDQMLKKDSLKDALKVDLSWDFIADNMMANTVDQFKAHNKKSDPNDQIPERIIKQLDAVRKTYQAFGVQAGRADEANDGIDPDLAALHHIGSKQAAHRHKESLVAFKEVVQKELRDNPGLSGTLHQMMSNHGEDGNNWLYLMNQHSDRLLFGSDTLAPTAKMHGADAYDINAKMLTPFYDIFEAVGDTVARSDATEGNRLKSVVSSIARDNYDAFIGDEGLLKRRAYYEEKGLNAQSGIGSSVKKSHTFSPEVAVHMPPSSAEVLSTEDWMKQTMTFANHKCTQDCC